MSRRTSTGATSSTTSSRSRLPAAVVLDFGCGGGTVVRMLRALGYEAYGVDIRWPGADYGDLERSDLGREGILRLYDEGSRLPFEDDVFDLVVSDMVFEHVVPIEASLAELERVLKPDGIELPPLPDARPLARGPHRDPVHAPPAGGARAARVHGGAAARRPRQVQGRAPGA